MKILKIAGSILFVLMTLLLSMYWFTRRRVLTAWALWEQSE